MPVRQRRIKAKAKAKAKAETPLLSKAELLPWQGRQGDAISKLETICHTEKKFCHPDAFSFLQ